MRKLFIIGVIVFCLTAGMASSLTASEHETVSRGWLYVGGSGPGNYSTIQGALDNATSGDTVFVYHGTYRENIMIDKDNITVIGENNGCIIDGRGSNVVTVSSNYISISGFELRNGTGSNHHGMILFDSSYDSILHNTFVDNNIGINVQAPCAHDMVFNNNFVNNTWNGYDYSPLEHQNQWDNGNVTGGNYWSDYSGVDGNNDGFGDTPYQLQGGANKDYYPLMFPFENYTTLSIVLANSTVLENTEFNVTVRSLAHLPIEEVRVTFLDRIALTDANGTVTLTAPGITKNTTYVITADKEGFTGTDCDITVINVPKAFVFGKISNLTITEDHIAFNAVKTRVVSLHPFNFNTYISGEPIVISKENIVVLSLNFIVAFCEVYK